MRLWAGERLHDSLRLEQRLFDGGLHRNHLGMFEDVCASFVREPNGNALEIVQALHGSNLLHDSGLVSVHVHDLDRDALVVAHRERLGDELDLGLERSLDVRCPLEVEEDLAVRKANSACK
jgi:hypothetical protein